MQEQVREDGADHPALRCSAPPRMKATVLHLHRCYQPSLDVQECPAAISMMPHRLQEKVVRDTVEEALDVEIEDPIETPAPLTSRPGGGERRAAGSVTVGGRVEPGFHQRPQAAPEGLLSRAVRDRRDAERARAAG